MTAQVSASKTPIRFTNFALFCLMASALVLVAYFESATSALTILNFCLIAAIMSLGVNMQWGFAGLLNVGVMGFVAIGGLAVVLVTARPVPEAVSAGAGGIVVAALVVAITVAALLYLRTRLSGTLGTLALIVVGTIGYFLARSFFDPSVEAIEAVEPAVSGFLGGLGLTAYLGNLGGNIVAWIVGGLFAAAIAFVIGKITLGLRSDYLAIATLGISEIIIFGLKNEDWLSRGVKNVNGLPRPVTSAVELQQSAQVQQWAADWGMTVIELSSILVKLGFAAIYIVVLMILLWLSETALRSPWGRMMRAIRDNETAAEAMGKDVKRQHLQIFILGSAVLGIAGAMLVSTDAQFTPGSYQPLRYTFLIWVMVIVGGSGNNWGAVLGGFVIGFFWIQAEPLGLRFMEFATGFLAEGNPVRAHLIDSVAHIRLMVMGLILLLVLRFSPRGLIPETKR